MKTLPFFVAMLGTFASIAQETPPPPIPDDPIIQLVKSEENTLDFSSLDLENYPNTVDEDLTRLTYPQFIVECDETNDEMLDDLPANIFEIDSMTFILTGKHETMFLQEHTIIIGEDTVLVNKVRTKEESFLRNYSDTVIRYENVYYSFVQDTTILFEVFEKKRIWMGNLAQTFVGVSINTFEKERSINLVLVPNPASDKTEALFELWKDGIGVLSITNPSATVNEQVYSGQLTQGENTVEIPLDEYPPGAYTITLAFDGQFFSTTLIIQ